MKKKLAATLSVVLILGLAVLGILAYLTSEDSDVNVMTLGNVKIEQIEQERAEDGTLQDFTGNDNDVDKKPLFPAVYEDITWDETKLDVNGVEYQVFNDEMKNVQDKIVTVKNTGKSDAYVRTFVAFEAPEGFNDNLLHLNYNDNDCTIGEWVYIVVGGERYVVTSFTYNDAVAAGTISAPSLMQVFLNKAATNEDMELLGDEYKILVLSQAVQTAGFETAAVAFDEAFPYGTDKAATIAGWFTDSLGILEDAAALHKSTTESGHFILGGDIKTSESNDRYGYGYEYIVRKGADYTLDLNGKTITFDTVNENAAHNAFTYLFVANNAGTKMTIDGTGEVYCNNSAGYTCAVQGKDGTLTTINGGDFEVDNGIAVWAGAGSHIIINDGSFVNGNATTNHELIYTSGGVIDIYGGFFHNTDGNYTLNVEDGNRATGFINVYGGTYVNFDPSTGGQDPNNIKVAEGYKVVSETQANGDVWYTVVAE